MPGYPGYPGSALVSLNLRPSGYSLAARLPWMDKCNYEKNNKIQVYFSKKYPKLGIFGLSHLPKSLCVLPGKTSFQLKVITN